MTSQPSFTPRVSIETDRRAIARTSCHRRLVRRGFTMIEILTVVAIIALLATITVVGFKNVGGNAKEKQTRILLERLRSAAAEITGTSKGKTQLNQVLIPNIYSDFTDPRDAAKWWDAVPASSTDSLLKTARMVLSLSSNSNFKAIIQQLPDVQKKLMVIDTSTGQFATASTTQQNRRDVVIPLDVWGNPILFVFDSWETPGVGGIGTRRYRAAVDTGGVSFVYSDATKSVWRTSQNPLPFSDAGSTPFDADMTSRSSYTLAGEAIRNDADRTSFWMSAGADEKYQTHDDNVYSFEGN